ncbi:MAG: carboxylesterase family protein [Bryobacteraceae bacterium]|nr:carboxylesterase family protein [Bryobacteraceae bacterium]
MKRTAVLLAAVAAFAAVDPVQVEQGSLAGSHGKDAAVRVFKGVPFAAPPVGELRWKSPRAPSAWTGVRQATEFSANCVQAAYPQGSLYYREPSKTSEDCLYLNIWTAARSSKDKLPVMVWIHGGALTRGSGSIGTYDGEALAKQGVVLVTINYRLNVFGFFAHPELTKESDRNASGNYGLLDQVAALEWVKKNIAAFGGDPDRVTIFGESAGSFSVNALTATPLAKGLFQRAIGQSGSMFRGTPKLADVEKEGARFGASVGELRSKPADEILKMAQSGFNFRPAVDGWFLPADIATIFREGKQNDVPTIAGFNQDEGTALAPAPATFTAEGYQKQVRQRYGAMADEFFALYPAQSEEDAKKAYYASYTHSGMGLGMRTWVRAQAASGKAPVYYYYFQRVPAGLAGAKYGSYHAAEIQYVFGNLSAAADETDRKLSQAMMGYWVNFARSGNPNGKGLPNWPAYQLRSDTAIVFGDSIRTGKGLLNEYIDFHEKASQRTRANP